ncbi:MAG: secondary thiamine-phosphate synthase enzyme YjbQ [Candidatus Omnitrophica bacterium]|nr:secondary thiamine-phosphate synthase enzyme YjbQ [Candidatus Omnitrophota bacterium]
MEKISVKTNSRIELIDITGKIKEAVSKSKVKNGACLLFCPHTTAGLTINENADPDVRRDMIGALNKLIPENAGYAHAEGNSDSHIKSSLFGSSLNIIVEGAELMLGVWQGIFFCESDGPRSREVWVQLLGQ